MKESQLDDWIGRHADGNPTAKFVSGIFLEHTTDSRKSTIELYHELQSDPRSVRSRANAEFLQQAKKDYGNYFDTIEDNPLTERQREACIIDEDNNLVLAGAGSGKTSVIIGKAGFVEKMKWARADEILILAYGKKASDETEERIAERLGEDSAIKSNTFHALGLGIIGKATGEKPSVHPSAPSDEPA